MPREWAASLQGAARGYMEGAEGEGAPSPARQPPAQQQQGRAQDGPYGAAVTLAEEQPRPRR